MRAIDADKLLETYKKWIPQLLSKEDEGDRRGVETCIAVLEDTPTIYAFPIVHGKWIMDDNENPYIRICSVCHHSRPMMNEHGFYCKTNYCPNCGERQWFKYNRERNGYFEIEEPECVKHLVNFSLG